jgi:hypothetical protein
MKVKWIATLEVCGEAIPFPSHRDPFPKGTPAERDRNTCPKGTPVEWRGKNLKGFNTIFVNIFNPENRGNPLFLSIIEPFLPTTFSIP